MNISKTHLIFSSCLIFIISLSILISPATAFSSRSLSTKESNFSNKSSLKKIITTMSFYQDPNASVLFINGSISVVFIGGLYCANCAMERWAIVEALNDLGSFKGLAYFYSAQDKIPTYDFANVNFTSNLVDFQAVEIANNIAPPHQQPLQKMNSLESALFNKYDPQGIIPFLCIGGSVYEIGAGASFNTTSFMNQPFAIVNDQLTSGGSLSDQIRKESNIISTILDDFIFKSSITLPVQTKFIGVKQDSVLPGGRIQLPILYYLNILAFILIILLTIGSTTYLSIQYLEYKRLQRKKHSNQLVFNEYLKIKFTFKKHKSIQRETLSSETLDKIQEIINENQEQKI